MNAASYLRDLQARIASGGDDGVRAQTELIELVQLGMERRAEETRLLNEAVELLCAQGRWVDAIACGLAGAFVSVHGSRIVPGLIVACADLCAAYL